MNTIGQKTAALITILVILTCLTACYTPPRVQGSANLPHSTTPKAGDSGDYTVESIAGLITEFSTHLPLITIEFRGSSGSDENNWFSGMEVSLYDATDANTLSDTPSVIIPTQGKVIADNTIENREKMDYYLRFYDDAETLTPHSLFGLDASSDYYLIGSMYDRSLLRNYLGYTLSSQITETAPAVRFCEVMLKDGENGYWYQGVYLLIEVKRTEGTVLFKRTTRNESMYLETYGYAGVIIGISPRKPLITGVSPT